MIMSSGIAVLQTLPVHSCAHTHGSGSDTTNKSIPQCLNKAEPNPNTYMEAVHFWTPNYYCSFPKINFSNKFRLAFYQKNILRKSFKCQPL